MKKEDKNFMKSVSRLIVNGRYVIFVLFIIAAVCSVFTMGKVKINSDIKSFLPKNTETRRGIDIMAREFTTYASANIMIVDIPYDEAGRLAIEIENIPCVQSVSFDDTSEHYKEGNALISVSFNGDAKDEGAIDAFNGIKDRLGDYDTYISSDIGSDYNEILAGEMSGVILISVVVIVTALLLTSRSYFEVVIFFIVFAFAGLINMGTNYWFGEISSITNSVAIILQLALSIDYSIIFCHRYQDEVARLDNEKDALVEALSKAIIEISSSSLTTVSGLVALTLMQFRLGYDLGTVLSKGIICSLLSVFLLMPGVIALFPKALKKTAHKSHIPDISPWGRFLTGKRFLFVILFFIILPFAIYFSSKTKYAFSDSSVDEIIHSESREAMRKITEGFDSFTSIAVLVPAKSYDEQLRIFEEVSAMEDIKSAVGIVGIDIGDGKRLTDKYSIDMVSELLDIDKEKVTLLFKGYRMEHEGFGAANEDIDDYEVALVDLFTYLLEKLEQGIVTLDDKQQKMLDELGGKLTWATNQLCGKEYDRIIFTSALPAESKESRELVKKISEIASGKFSGEDILVIGDITSARDLSDTYTGDSIKISLLTIGFVFLILLFTFKTFFGAVVLVFVIQGSIWINFSFPYLQSFSTSFVTNMIVSAIQMGATIDYAIVIMNRYLTAKQEKEKKEAMVAAVSESFATVMTSGSILTAAGFLIAYRVSDVYVGHIGLAVGRGALISIVLVMTVLPQLILMFDKLIEKTRFKKV